MKKWMVMFLVALMSVTPVSAANVNNFYFSDFTGDYYLSKDASGVSRLKVVEQLTAEFPDYKQNRGICRQIPFMNQDGANVTLPELTRSDITVLRNGETEPIYSIEMQSDYYEVCTGTDEYVFGEQVYTFEYEFEKVVTDFKDYQELYWDTNGNGWSQKFNMVTARVHFEDESVYTGKNWCYVGLYGKKGQDRCTVTRTEDGVEFVAHNLSAGENLTFDTELKPGGFMVPDPVYNYTLVWVLLGILGVCVLCLMIGPGRKWLKARKKKKFYQSLFVKPEYQPDARYSLPEMAEVYTGKKKDVTVAMLLNLIVQKKVSLIKGENGKWSLRREAYDGIRSESNALLKILNGGSSVGVGEVIEIKKHKASVTLSNLGDELYHAIERDMRQDGLMEKGYKCATARKRPVLNIIIGLVFYAPFCVAYATIVVRMIQMSVETGSARFGKMLLDEEFVPMAMTMILITVLAWWLINKKRKKWEYYTEDGLRAARYMDGLKMYIEMAEADRLKYLQSVEGADTSAEGIVKLYEKLLPYAAVFGLEKSWMEELEKYCQVQGIEEPVFLDENFTFDDISRVTNDASRYARSASVDYSSGSGGISGGGSWSSGGSGGGGGGSSGGGGGGGGGGGR